MQRTVAMLFTDLKGSTSFYRTHGNLAGRVMIQKHNALLFPVIEEYGGVVVATMGDAIIAYFEDPDKALQASLKMQQTLAAYNHEAKEDEQFLIRIALHYGECLIEEHNLFGYAADTAAALVAACSVGEIVVSEDFLKSLKNSVLVPVSPYHLDHAPELLTHVTVYRVRWDTASAPSTPLDEVQASGARDGSSLDLDIFTELLLPQAVADGQAVACFYCGMTAHEPSRCPSKLLRHSTKSFEKLASLPFSELRRIYREYGSEFIRPLVHGEEESRFDLLFEQSHDSEFALGFFCLYEITEIFQLRSIHRLFAMKDSSDEAPYRPSGALLLGRDCLRVARDRDAEAWFHEAIKDNPSDYRPYVDMGIIAMEQMDPSRAINCFRRAFAAARSERVRRHLSLLIARVYEIIGAVSQACDEVKKILDPAHPWQSVVYYCGVLLAKSGKKNEALSLFASLCEQSEQYYVMLLLDPALNPVRAAIGEWIKSRYQQLSERSRESFDTITKTFTDIQRYFSENDPEWQTAHQLYQQAQRLLQEASFGGLSAVVGIELELTRLVMRAAEQRQAQAQDKVAKFWQVLQAYARYLEQYPYKRAFSVDDISFRDYCREFIERAATAVDTISLERLQAAQELIAQLAPLSEKIEKARQSLELRKNLYFTVEFTSKLLGVFFVTSIGAGIFFVLIVSAYEVFTKTLSAFSFEAFIHCCRHSLVVGFFSGLLGAALWFKRSFRKMLAKLGE